MKYNYLCKYYIKGKKCEHAEKCSFSHDLYSLEKTPCKFHHCKLVTPIFKGIYYNKCKDNVCPFWHKDEIHKSYGARMGMKFVTKDTSKPFSLRIPKNLKHIFDDISKKISLVITFTD